MSAPTVVSSSSGSTTAAGDFSVAAPASISGGNLLVAFQATEGILLTTPADPPGWTALVGSTWDTGSGYLACYYKVAGSEPGSYTFHTGDGNKSVVFILNLSGADPAPDRFGAGSGSGSTTATCASWNVADVNKRVLCAAACNANTTISAWNNAPADLGTVAVTGLSADVAHLSFSSLPGSDESASLGASSNWATLVVTVPGPAGPPAVAARPRVLRPPLHPSYLE